jgi:hypothetical protein
MLIALAHRHPLLAWPLVLARVALLAAGAYWLA